MGANDVEQASTAEPHETTPFNPNWVPDTTIRLAVPPSDSPASADLPNPYRFYGLPRLSTGDRLLLKGAEIVDNVAKGFDPVTPFMALRSGVNSDGTPLTFEQRIAAGRQFVNASATWATIGAPLAAKGLTAAEGGAAASVDGMVLKTTLADAKVNGNLAATEASARLQSLYATPGTQPIRVIGSMKDVSQYSGRFGFNTFTPSNWRLTEAEVRAENVLWMKQGIGSGATYWQVTNPETHTILMKSIGKSSSYLNLEIPMLREAGVNAVPKYATAPAR